MLEAAERQEFQVLLLENQDRLGRFDSVEGAQYFARLRNAGVQIITAADGRIDLDSFEGRVMNTIRQEGKHSFLRDLSRKVLRGQIHNAKQGNSNGGARKYAMDRVLVTPAGKHVRRLVDGETVRMPGHRVRHVPGTDRAKIAAVKYMFKRFASADVSFRQLARELDARGYPSPTGKGWQVKAVSKILTNPIYVGEARWGARSVARYHTNQGDAIVPAGNGSKPAEDAIEVNGGQAIVDRKLFDRVQRRAAKRSRKDKRSSRNYPLSGLIVCGNCGQPMHGRTAGRKDRHGNAVYAYEKYLCAS